MKKMKFIYFVYFLFPLINLITGLMTRYDVFPLTVGIVIRVLLLLFMIMYLLLESKSKYKKISTIYLISIFIFCFIYLITRENILNFSILFDECNYLFKFIYLPIMFFGMLNLMDEYKYNRRKWNTIFLSGLIFYLVWIIIPMVTRTSFYAYIDKYYGVIGWFYAANEVGPILLMLFPSVFTLLDKHKICYFITSFLGILVIMLLLTKVSKYGLIILLVLFTISYFIFVRRKWSNKICLIITLMFLAFLNISYGERMLTVIERATFIDRYRPVKKEIVKYRVISENIPINNSNNSTTNNQDEYKNPTLSEVLENHTNKNITDKTKLPDATDENFSTKLLSSRNKRVKRIFKDYSKNSLKEKLLGFGFNLKETTLIEMDFFDILYHYGLIGFILLIFPYLYIVGFTIRSIIKRKFKFTNNLIFTTILCGLLLSIAFLAGHIIGSPAVGSYLCILGVYICAMLDNDLLLEVKEDNEEDN